MTTGWVCPKCGQVYAPWVQKCEPCAPVPAVPWYPRVYPVPITTPAMDPYTFIKINCGGPSCSSD